VGGGGVGVRGGRSRTGEFFFNPEMGQIPHPSYLSVPPRVLMVMNMKN